MNRTDTVEVYWKSKIQKKITEISYNFTKHNDLKEVRERNNKLDKFHNLIIFNRHSTHNMYLINSYNDAMDNNCLIHAYNNKVHKSNAMTLLEISRHIKEENKISKIS